MNNRMKKIWFPLLVVLALMIGIVFGINLQSKRQISFHPKQINNNNKIGVILSLIEGNYVDSVDTKKLVESAIPEI